MANKAILAIFTLLVSLSFYSCYCSASLVTLKDPDKPQEIVLEPENEPEVIIEISDQVLQQWTGSYKPVVYVSLSNLPSCGKETGIGIHDPGQEESWDAEIPDEFVTLEVFEEGSWTLIGNYTCDDMSSFINPLDSGREHKGWQSVRVSASEFFPTSVTIKAELRITRNVYLDLDMPQTDLLVRPGIEYWLDPSDVDPEAFVTLSLIQLECLDSSDALTIQYVNHSDSWQEDQMRIHFSTANSRTNKYLAVNSFGPLRFRLQGALNSAEVTVTLHKPSASSECEVGFTKCASYVYNQCPGIANKTFCMPKSHACDGRLSCPASCSSHRNRHDHGDGSHGHSHSEYSYAPDEDRDHCIRLYCREDYVCYIELRWIGQPLMWFVSMIFFFIIIAACFGLFRRLLLTKQGARRGRNSGHHVVHVAADPVKLAPPPTYDEVVVSRP